MCVFNCVLKGVFVVVYCVWYVLCCCLRGVIKHDDDDDFQFATADYADTREIICQFTHLSLAL